VHYVVLLCASFSNLGIFFPPDLRVRKWPCSILWQRQHWQLQEQLSAKKITSMKLCKIYVDQNIKHDPYLKAMLALAPSAHTHAALLNGERLRGQIRGSLYGILVLVKVKSGALLSVKVLTTTGQYRDTPRSRDGHNSWKLCSCGLAAVETRRYCWTSALLISFSDFTISTSLVDDVCRTDRYRKGSIIGILPSRSFWWLSMLTPRCS